MLSQAKTQGYVYIYVDNQLTIVTLRSIDRLILELSGNKNEKGFSLVNFESTLSDFNWIVFYYRCYHNVSRNIIAYCMIDQTIT